jgi:chemotaxis regulatin CheY-phosphate phosphatase CheZ
LYFILVTRITLSFVLYLTEERIDELKIIFLEEEIKELKHALREARNRNTYLTNLLEQAEQKYITVNLKHHQVQPRTSFYNSS